MSSISRKRKRTSSSLKPSPSPPAVFPDVMLGTYRMKDDKIIKKVIKKCLPVCGGLDTATIYGNQPSIGRAIASEGLLGGGRDGVPTPWVQTKLWRSVKPEDVVKTIKKDLKDLQIERLDCWLMHWPGPGRHLNYPPVTRTDVTVVKADVREPDPSSSESTLLYDIEDVGGPSKPSLYLASKIPNANPSKVISCPSTWSPSTRHKIWSQMSKCVDLGYTSTLGVSNFTLPQLRSLLTYCSTHNLHPPTLLQNEFNPLITLPPNLLNFLHINNITYQAHTCLGGRSKFLLNHPTVIKIAEKLRVETADVLFRYAKKKVGNIIIKSDYPEKVIKNFRIMKCGEWDITEEDMNRLDGFKEEVEFKGFGEGGTVFSWVREESPSFYD
ncbi:hypothetical protein TrVE_jg11375 [Triparma verrucosa]|uniref:NADP-dependent oxidoreductase domain-containing protein n=1 Tax=Triparma verrucosa TaxID=1606542 RepID=A0A9W7B492_9STRA|nr:hypothetical protein TrVE_jg11375 [Triparma verrucosa]